MNHKYANRVKSMKNTRLGKLVCRLFGEESGQAMMEYVIIAVAIAAVVALGAFLFGSTILDWFGIASKSTAGRPEDAADDAVAVQTEVGNRVDAANANGDKFNKNQPTHTNTDN